MSDLKYRYENKRIRKYTLFKLMNKIRIELTKIAGKRYMTNDLKSYLQDECAGNLDYYKDIQKRAKDSYERIMIDLSMAAE